MRKPFYPPLIAAFLVLALFNANVQQLASPKVAAIPLLIAIGLSIALWLVMSVALRSWQKAALTACVLIPMFLCYGHFRGIFGIDEGITLTVWVMVIAGMALVTLLIRKPPTLILNITAICLTLVVLVPFSIFAISTPPIPTRTTSGALEGTNTPDIYYIIVDEYSRNDVLLDVCNFDNSDFTDWLCNKGFYVADDSYSSYPATCLAITSALSINYIPEELGNPVDMPDIADLIDQSGLYKQLRESDYTIININSWWSGDLLSKSANINYYYDSYSRFFRLFSSMTLLHSEPTDLGSYYKGVEYQLNELKKVPLMAEPTFTCVHLLLTHPPFVANADGTIRNEIYWSHRESNPDVEIYIDSIRVANNLLRDVIDTILAKGNAVIILQSDTGTYADLYTQCNSRGEDPHNRYFAWARLANLTAVYPDIGHEFTLSVNTFRIILNHYFDTDYKMLSSRYFMWRGSPSTKVFDITNELKEYINK